MKMSDEKNKEQLAKKIEGLLQAKINAEDSPLGQLTPLSIWAFSGVFDDTEPGRMKPVADDAFDADAMKSDVLLCRSIYQDLIQEADSVQTALQVTCFAVFGEERKRDANTVLATYNGFESMQVFDALPAIGMAMQASFEYQEGGTIAVFSIADTLHLVMEQYAKRKRSRHSLHMLKSELAIPVQESSDAALSNCFLELHAVGTRVLNFMKMD